MNITINSKNESLKTGITVSELLKIKKVQMVETIIVQLNGEFIDSQKFDSTAVKEEDKVDFLYFMGGGR